MNGPDEDAVCYDPFAGAELARAVPSTGPQREIWLAAEFGRDGTLSYNLAVAIRLRGPLDAELLCSALEQVVQRHDALRASFSADGRELLIARTLFLECPFHDLSALPADAAESALAGAYLRAVQTPYDLAAGPLFRAEMWRVAAAQESAPGDTTAPSLASTATPASEHVLILAAHHSILDGWSFGVLIDELRSIYAALVRGAPIALLAAPSFADYALQQALLAETAAHAQAERYWLEQFRGPLPALDLPTDWARPPQRQLASAREDWQLDATLVEGLKRYGAQRGASLFTSLLAAFGLLLQRIAGTREVVVGVPVAGQSTSGLAQLVGHCVNLLPIRVISHAGEKFEALLARTRSTVMDALEHPDYTFGTLIQKLVVARDPSRLPLVNVLFNLDQVLDALDFGTPGLSSASTNMPRTYENFELFLNAQPRAGSIELECQFSTALFSAATVRGWLEAFESLLRGLVAKPDTASEQLPLNSAAALARLEGFQPVASDYPQERLAHQWFEAQAGRTPGRCAVSDSRSSLTYAQLDARANQLAHVLRARGIGRGALVGIAVSRSCDLPVVVLGVLKSGAGYVPLDPAFPPARLQLMAADAAIVTVIVDTDLPRGLENFERTIRMGELDAVSSQAPERDVRLDATADSPAYVIYTSGSTGTPKGVVVPHATTANFLHAMQLQPGIEEDDVLVAVTTLSFDIAFFELMLPLSVGAQIVVTERETVQDGQALRALIEERGISYMQATPAGWRLLLDAGFQGSPRFTAISGGEPLAPDLARALLDRCARVFNGYGPTETTVYSTMWEVVAPEQGITIGRPVANTRIEVRDEHGGLALQGVPGELWIAGAGVASGYLERPELTRERFIDVTAGNGECMRMYRSGDRGRWRNDGLLQHLGRLDFQLKVRGFRIEPGEIEAALSQASGVLRTVLVAREDRPGDVRLVAYFVAEAGRSIRSSDLQQHLRQTLPDYLLPQHFVELAALPLLPNGKLDRQALPAPEAPLTAAREQVRPRDELETAVHAAFEAVLAKPGLSIHDDFFELGGHSLLAAELTARLGREFGLRLPLRTLFAAPNPAALTTSIRAQLEAVAPKLPALSTIPRQPDQSSAPLSLQQQRMLFLEDLHPGRTVHHTPSGHRLAGALDQGAFERAWQEMIRRQPSLRTAFVMTGEFAEQRIVDELPFALFPADDLSLLPPPEQEAELERRLASLIAEPFDLSRPPLFRACMFKLADEAHVLGFVAHHLIWDGGSFDLLFRELGTLYSACRRGQPVPLPALTRSYVDYAVWQRAHMQGAELAEQVRHWKARLEGALEPLQLPTDKPRPPAMSGRAGTVWLRLEQSLVGAARALAQRSQATLFQLLLAIYAVLLQRLSGQRDLIIATPVRGRDAEGLDDIIGFFVNALPLRISLDPLCSFSAALTHAREAVLDAFLHPDIPLEHLVHALGLPRDESRTPLYQAFFSYQDARARALDWGGLAQQPIDLAPPAVAEDLALWFIESNEGLTAGLTYNADIFEHATIERHGERLLGLLRAALADPSQALARLPLLTATEHAQLASWNDTDLAFPRKLGMHGAFEAQAARTPWAIALRFEPQSMAAPGLVPAVAPAPPSAMSYAELEARANQIAHALLARGVGPGQRVGLCLERSPQMLEALLGVLKCGAAYVPLDPDFPTARVQAMIEDAGLSQLVSVTELSEQLGVPSARCLNLDVDLEAIESLPVTRPEIDIDPAAAAYVIYTSGSTGQPKGVVVAHSAVANFLFAMQQRIPIGPTDRLVAVTTLSFDIAVLELMLPISVGAELTIATREVAMDGSALAALIDTVDASLLQATPATWRLLLDAGWNARMDFRVLCGGEPLPPDLGLRLRAQTREVYNLYGPTETTVWSTAWKVEHAAAGISIGTPIANTQVWVLDEHGEHSPPGVPGELYIGGEGVSTGYHARPQLTDERFLPDPFSSKPGARLYRTGDRGRWLASGLLEHLGRIDFQVKVRGHRIELGEIETALGAQPDVADCLVLARADTPGETRLIAYLTAAAHHELDPVALRQSLRRTLPDYMVPQQLVVLGALPRLPNGKVDRKALPAPQPEIRPARTDRRAPATAVERQLAELWAELLHLTDISPDDNFFDLGGHSLLAMQAIARMQVATGKRINPRRYIFQTLAQVAQSYEELTVAPAPAPSVIGRLFSALRGRGRGGDA